jgi:adenylate cyclase class 2
MAQGNKEIEIKVRIERKGPLVSFMRRHAKYIGKSRQVDEYFMPYHRNFLSRQPVREWLRLRREGALHTVNYKSFHFDKQGKSTECDEFETQIKDAGQMRRIFMALDMKPIVKVDKVRTSWAYKDYEISADSVSGLGTFVEIEFKGGGGDSKGITDGMVRFLKAMKVGTIQRNYQGYPFLLLFPDKSKYFKE